jgi:hypothetical protein
MLVKVEHNEDVPGYRDGIGRSVSPARSRVWVKAEFLSNPSAVEWLEEQALRRGVEVVGMTSWDGSEVRDGGILGDRQLNRQSRGFRKAAANYE